MTKTAVYISVKFGDGLLRLYILVSKLNRTSAKSLKDVGSCVDDGRNQTLA